MPIGEGDPDEVHRRNYAQSPRDENEDMQFFSRLIGKEKKSMATSEAWFEQRFNELREELKEFIRSELRDELHFHPVHIPTSDALRKKGYNASASFLEDFLRTYDEPTIPTVGDLRLAGLHQIADDIEAFWNNRYEPKKKPKPKLNPCPFCKSTDVEVIVRYSNTNYKYVGCDVCEARGPEHEEEMRAIVMWNTTHQ